MSIKFDENTLDRLKKAIELCEKQEPHEYCELRREGYGEKHIYHWYICKSRIAKKFMDKIYTLVGCLPFMSHSEVRWYPLLTDSARFDIYGPTIVLRVCAGRIGKLDGKPSKDWEVTLYTRRDKDGEINHKDICCYWHDDHNDPPHAEATSSEFWKQHPELEELEFKGVREIVEQFCEVMC